jgi:hypothetical protein
MPKQKRWEEKRKLDQAVAHLNNAEDCLIEVCLPFEEVHPEYFDAFISIMCALDRVSNAINEMYQAI